MLFIFIVNFLGFIPLPLTGETWHGVPVWGIYAATSSISVTLALALLTFFFTHIEGIRWNGPVRYFKSWIPDAPKPLLGTDRPARDPRAVHAAHFAERPSFREHARGPHPDPHVHRPDLHPAVARARGLCRPDRGGLLHVRGRDRDRHPGLIFAALSAIYIGSAIEPEH